MRATADLRHQVRAARLLQPRRKAPGAEHACSRGHTPQGRHHPGRAAHRLLFDLTHVIPPSVSCARAARAWSGTTPQGYPVSHAQGTSRGGADIQEIVKRLSLWGVNMLFVGAALLCCILHSETPRPHHRCCVSQAVDRVHRSSQHPPWCAVPSHAEALTRSAVTCCSGRQWRQCGGQCDPGGVRGAGRGVQRRWRPQVH